MTAADLQTRRRGRGTKVAADGGHGRTAMVLVMWPRRLVVVAALAVVWGAFLGCGVEKPTPSADGRGPAAPEVCGADWQVIFSPRQDFISIPPKVMRWHDGRLYVSIHGLHPRLVAI